MKKYFAHGIFIIISFMTLTYVASHDHINLLYIVLACAAIIINYQLLIPHQSKQKIPSQ